MGAVVVHACTGNLYAFNQLHPQIAVMSALLLSPWSLMSAARCLALVAVGLSSSVASASVVLAPQYSGGFAAGGGADAAFHRIDGQWSDSRIVWKDPDPIGSYAWGDGLWGRNDWQRVVDVAAGRGGAADPTIVQSWTGSVGSINYGNVRYQECFDAVWGSAALVPMFAATAPSNVACDDAKAGDADQHNWISHFSGFIRIVDPGLYNFSVLYDDGFFFRLIGEGGQALEIEKDYLNSRDRKGFGDNLALSAGLYGFELGSWNRLGAGVVDLRWMHGGDPAWTLVPTQNLVRAASLVDEPAALTLAGLALAVLVAARRRSSHAYG